jgi:hypothetical protein
VDEFRELHVGHKVSSDINARTLNLSIDDRCLGGRISPPETMQPGRGAKEGRSSRSKAPVDIAIDVVTPWVDCEPGAATPDTVPAGLPLVDGSSAPMLIRASPPLAKTTGVTARLANELDHVVNVGSSLRDGGVQLVGGSADIAKI